MHLFNTITFYLTSLLVAIMPTNSYSEGIVGQPRSFLPHQTVTQNDKTISSLIYRGLFKYDIYGELVPDLVDSWEIKEDGLVYVIALKKGQKWSDGSEITADDLIYTSFKLPELQEVATDKIDDYTVRFTLPNKYSPFLNLLTIGVMQSASEENYSGLTPVSSGNFRVLRIKRSGPIIKEVVLVDKDPKSTFNRLIFKYYSNEDELLTAAQLGEFDGFLSSENVDLPNYDEYRYPLQGVYYAIFFNLRDDKLQNVELRQKMEYVLDKEKMITTLGIPVQGPISRSVYTDTSIEFDNYDEDFTEVIGSEQLTLTIPDLEEHELLANMLKDAWEDKLGLKIEIKKVNAETFIEDIVKPRKFELLLYGQETSRDPDRYVNWHSTQKVDPGLNLSGFEHVRADRALEEGRNQYEQKDRMVHYHEFQKVISEQVPAIFLYHPYADYYVNKYIQGFGDKYTFSLKDRFLDFSNWSRVATN